MSFTNETKQEIANVELALHCGKAELSALIQLTSSLTISNGGLGLLVRSENPTTAKRIVFYSYFLNNSTTVVITVIEVKKKPT